MKKLLYILLSIFLVIILFYIFFPRIPGIEFGEQADREEKIKTLDVWLTSQQEKDKFNGSIAILKQGTPVFINSYGYTDQNLNIPLTNDTPMRLGSVSKQFTAAGIMLLHEQNVLNYDDLVIKHIPNFPYRNVTIRHLLNNASGIPDIYMDLASRQKGQISFLTNEKVLELIVNEQEPIHSSPGEVFEYSNTNYVILAHIAEIAFGDSFEEFMQQELFTPLGMHNTRIWNLASKDQDFPNRASDFSNDKGKTEYIKRSFLDGVTGDGSVFSSINDMIIWNEFWNGNNLISDENMKEAFITPVLDNEARSIYGFGWIITEDNAWHNGSWLGARTLIERNAKDEYVLIVLDNSSNQFFDQVTEEIQDVISEI